MAQPGLALSFSVFGGQTACQDFGVDFQGLWMLSRRLTANFSAAGWVTEKSAEPPDYRDRK